MAPSGQTNGIWTYFWAARSYWTRARYRLLRAAATTLSVSQLMRPPLRWSAFGHLADVRNGRSVGLRLTQGGHPRCSSDSKRPVRSNRETLRRPMLLAKTLPYTRCVRELEACADWRADSSTSDFRHPRYPDLDYPLFHFLECRRSPKWEGQSANKTRWRERRGPFLVLLN
jgi:hypothetical protein